MHNSKKSSLSSIEDELLQKYGPQNDLKELKIKQAKNLLSANAKKINHKNFMDGLKQQRVLELDFALSLRKANQSA